jgi:peptidoglycan/xylan/chitin deacetylase (PgdA/CDA1 family)
MVTRIPITMCHGTQREAPARAGRSPLTPEHFRAQMELVRELGFQSVSYDDLAAWRAGGEERGSSGARGPAGRTAGRVGKGTLPPRPIMLDFDHPVISMRYEVREVLDDLGFRGNLFVNTGGLEEMYRAPLPPREERKLMTWEELGELRDSGWHLGAHTVSHPNLSQLSVEDPSGERLRAELDGNNETLRARLGIDPRDFAFTGTSWSSQAEAEVKRRYRFGRLWIVGSEYQVDGRPLRYAELVGAPGPDEADGGPPAAARYATRESDPYRLPSIDLQYLLYELPALRRYLLGALDDSAPAADS